MTTSPITLPYPRPHRGVDHEPEAPTVALNNVSVAYPAGDRTTAPGQPPPLALENLSAHIYTGERIAIVGPNGAGKSTVLKLIAGALRPSSGTVRVFGHGPAGHICIAYVPQRNQIYWSFPVTVEDVVMMGRVGQIGLFRWPGRRDWALVRESLARVNAGHLAKKQIGELSGGQQQRVFIARALAQEAEILLLDEPLTGLDLPSQEATFEILEGLRPDNVTILMATHDLSMAASHFDRVMLLNRRLIAFGPPAEALSSDYLLQAYGGHLHRIQDDTGRELVLTDTCCDDETL